MHVPLFSAEIAAPKTHYTNAFSILARRATPKRGYLRMKTAEPTVRLEIQPISVGTGRPSIALAAGVELWGIDMASQPAFRKGRFPRQHQRRRYDRDLA